MTRAPCADYNRLVDSHLGKVRVIARLLARKPVDWKDLAQEGVIAMLEAAPRYQEDQGQFWPFVYPRIRGAMLDFLGRQSRETFHEELSRVRVLSGDPSDKLSLSIDIERAMQKLTAQERRVFHALRAGHAPRGIAGMLNITQRRVNQIRERAERRLREELVA